MRTINDPVLSPLTTIVHDNERRIDYYTREGMEGSLFLAFLNIRDAADAALERLNRRQWPDGKPR